MPYSAWQALFCMANRTECILFVSVMEQRDCFWSGQDGQWVLPPKLTLARGHKHNGILSMAFWGRPTHADDEAKTTSLNPKP
jgi:hypothetical protein